MHPLTILFLLLVWHALADYPLQGDFLARAKNPRTPIDGVPWPLAMGAHCLIHAGGVYLVTGSMILALFELVAHWVIDELKCHGTLSFTQDQIAHVVFKVAYVLLLLLKAGPGS